MGDWEDNADFAPHKIADVVRDLSFGSMVDLVVELDHVLQDMCAWCERCPCHEHVQACGGILGHPPFVVCRGRFRICLNPVGFVKVLFRGGALSYRIRPYPAHPGQTGPYPALSGRIRP